MGNQIQYLDVPFSEKEQAKSLGAWWDPEARKWFIPRGKAPEPFAKWLSDDGGAEEKREQR